MRKTKGVKMSDLKEFEELEKDICAFAEEMQSKGHKVHYEGPFITGKLENPKILFLSINPGGGDETVTKNDFKKVKFKHLDERYPLAKELEYIFGRNILENSCETYMESFFATVGKTALNELLARFDKESRKEHDELCEKMLELALETKPKMIVIIGLGSFGYFCDKDENKLKPNNEKPDSERRYLLSTEYNGIPVYGIIHLSGARPSNAMKDELQRFFAEKISKN